MPRLSNTGRVCAPGTGSAIVSIDGIVIESNSGDANWINDLEVAFVHHAAGQIVAHHISTGARRVLYQSGANWLRARDGGWARWLNGEIRTSAGWAQTGGYLAELSQGYVLIADGTLQTLTVYTIGGHVVAGPLATGTIGDDATSGLNVRLRERLLLYQGNLVWHLLTADGPGWHEIPIAPRIEDISYAIPLTIDGHPWLLERSDRLTLRPYDSTLGYVITDELCFSPDAVPYGAGARIAWSITQGQGPSDVHLADQSVTLPRVELNTSPTAFVWCDVASSGPHEIQYVGTLYPRVDVSPAGAWVAADGHFDDTVFVRTSAGVRMDLGLRHPINPACPRFQTDQQFHLYMVAKAADGSVFGRHLVFGEHGQYLEERPHFDASLAGSQGIQDVTMDGVILWWDVHNWRVVDGVNLRNWRERGDWLIGVIQEDPDNRPVVFEKSTKRWFRVGAWNIQVLAGIAENGTASVQADDGGFVPRADWLTRPFDPHHIEPDEPDPPVITVHPQDVEVEQGQTATFTVVATGTAPLHYEWAVQGFGGPLGEDAPTFTTPPLENSAEVWVTVSNAAGAVTSEHALATVTIPIDPVEPNMTRSTVLVDEVWYEVEEMAHPDAGPEHGPVVGVKRVSDGFMLKVRGNGHVEFEAGSPGADERLIPVPGAYVALREATIVVDKAGPWQQ